jgi:hypothetical protein
MRRASVRAAAKRGVIRTVAATGDPVGPSASAPGGNAAGPSALMTAVYSCVPTRSPSDTIRDGALGSPAADDFRVPHASTLGEAGARLRRRHDAW